jgi:hypothetical protein
VWSRRRRGATDGSTAKAGQNDGEGVERAGVDAGVQNVGDVGKGREGGERQGRTLGMLGEVERVGRGRREGGERQSRTRDRQSRGPMWMPASRTLEILGEVERVGRAWREGGERVERVGRGRAERGSGSREGQCGCRRPGLGMLGEVERVGRGRGEGVEGVCGCRR